MAFLNSQTEEDLVNLAREFEVDPDPDIGIEKLKNLITSNEDYEENMAESILSTIVKVRLEKEEREREKRKREEKEEREREERKHNRRKREEKEEREREERKLEERERKERRREERKLEEREHEERKREEREREERRREKRKLEEREREERRREKRKLEEREHEERKREAIERHEEQVRSYELEIFRLKLIIHANQNQRNSEWPRPESETDLRRDTSCFHCKQFGHLRLDCPELKRNFSELQREIVVEEMPVDNFQLQMDEIKESPVEVSKENKGNCSEMQREEVMDEIPGNFQLQVEEAGEATVEVSEMPNEDVALRTAWSDEEARKNYEGKHDVPFHPEVIAGERVGQVVLPVGKRKIAHELPVGGPSGEAKTTQRIKRQRTQRINRHTIKKAHEIDSENARRSKEAYKSQYNLRSGIKIFDVGDKVVKLIPSSSPVLRSSWMEPATVIERRNSFKVELDDGRLVPPSVPVNFGN